MLGHIVTD